MSTGKYSPTVCRWYRLDQKWHEKFCLADEYIDIDGYDSYGYHQDTGLDRAGYSEYDYMSSYRYDHNGDIMEYDLYDIILDSWCTKPIPVRS